MIITTIVAIIVTPVLWAMARYSQRRANYRRAMQHSAALDRAIARQEKHA